MLLLSIPSCTPASFSSSRHSRLPLLLVDAPAPFNLRSSPLNPFSLASAHASARARRALFPPCFFSLQAHSPKTLPHRVAPLRSSPADSGEAIVGPRQRPPARPASLIRSDCRLHRHDAASHLRSRAPSVVRYWPLPSARLRRFVAAARSLRLLRLAPLQSSRRPPAPQPPHIESRRDRHPPPPTPSFLPLQPLS
ncbi:hypothetical protein CDD83_2924 [Cordyceps sp. RAO-2017]|nr:hypothetical protein CDD83_2924 [Cordyceps sp. RAO-2017]